MLPTESIRRWLESAVRDYNRPEFIADDPISIPHSYTKLQDIEIAGFFTALIAWGQRKTIIRSARELMRRMDDAPHQFIRNHLEKDRARFVDFRHRTMQPDDVLYLLEVLQQYYRSHTSLEDAFARHLLPEDEDVGPALAGFHDLLFDQPHVLERTRKHIATPVRKSSCKRLNMFLRWMVRTDTAGVDFGLWSRISPSQLIIPLDVHVGKVARHLQLLQRPANDWQAARELTLSLKKFDPVDPVRYDFALFGAGVSKRNYPG